MTARKHCNVVGYDFDRKKKFHCLKGFGHTVKETITPVALIHSDGKYFWTEGDTIVRTWSIDALWLTGGGRVVKPGLGEMASTIGDFLILTPQELERGVKYEVFMQRLRSARRKWNRRFGKKGL